MSHYDVRPATSADVPALAALLTACDLRIKGVSYDTFTPPVLVAVLGEEIIGMVSALVGHPVSYIAELAIHPAHHHNGIATSLMHSMETLLRVLGVTTWVAFVHVDRLLHEYIAQWPGVFNAGPGEGWVRRL